MKSRSACWLNAVLLTALAGPAKAQPPELAELLARIAASSGVEAEFHESKELTLLAAPLESRGTIYFAPPGRFARFTTEPRFSALIVGADEIRLREGAGEPEVDLSGNRIARVFADNIIVLWSGDREELDRLYAAEFGGSSAAWELRLAPRSAPLSEAIASIVLRGDAEAMREMTVEELDGDRTVTRFDSVASDRDFTPAEIERIFVAGEPLRGADGAR